MEDFTKRLEGLEKIVSEIRERQIREEERERLKAEAQRRAWEFVKSVLVPTVVALIIVWATK